LIHQAIGRLPLLVGAGVDRFLIEERRDPEVAKNVVLGDHVPPDGDGNPIEYLRVSRGEHRDEEPVLH